MFSIGQYKVEFRHRSDKDSVVLIHKNKNPKVKALTYCMIKNVETCECLSTSKLLVENGGNLSKNSRRKESLAKCLQEIFPSNGGDYRKRDLNKKARTLFWQEYFKKRGKF
jgi:hypothetical protein